MKRNSQLKELLQIMSKKVDVSIKSFPPHVFLAKGKIEFQVGCVGLVCNCKIRCYTHPDNSLCINLTIAHSKDMSPYQKRW